MYLGAIYCQGFSLWPWNSLDKYSVNDTIWVSLYKAMD